VRERKRPRHFAGTAEEEEDLNAAHHDEYVNEYALFTEEYAFVARETYNYDQVMRVDPQNYGEAAKTEIDMFI
jgi:hypothetical protein